MSSTSNPNKRGLRTAYISTVASIVMVLFIIGVAAWFILGLNHLKDSTIESFEIDLFFEKSVSDVELGVIEREIAEKPYASSASYRSSEEAWEILVQEVGDSALTVIDNENPLNQSIILTLNKDYFSSDSVEMIKSELTREYPGQLAEVSYRPEVFEEVNANLQKLVYFGLLIALMLLFIAIGLINMTIRLSM